MTYSGRITSLPVTLSYLGLTIYDLSYGYLDAIHVVVYVFYVCCGWWLGKKYDHIKHLAEKDDIQ